MKDYTAKNQRRRELFATLSEEEKEVIRKQDRQRYYEKRRPQVLKKAKQYYTDHREEVIQKNTVYKKTPVGQETARRYNTSEKCRNTEQTYWESTWGRSVVLFNGAKGRAKNKKLPFTITVDMVYNRLEGLNGVSEVVADSFDFTHHPRVKQNPYAPSLDQKIPGVGYTPENFQIVVFWYNRFKGNLTDDEALNILRCAHVPQIGVAAV